MPFAWMRRGRNDLGFDGYLSPDGRGCAFVGWTQYNPITGTMNTGSGTAVQLYIAVGSTHYNLPIVENAGYWFLAYFYGYFLYGTNLRTSLDLAANATWDIRRRQPRWAGIDFYFCPFSYTGREYADLQWIENGSPKSVTGWPGHLWVYGDGSMRLPR